MPQVLNGILTTADLKTATGYERSADVERCLRDQGVRFYWGKEGPWTTVDLINAASGLQHAANQTMRPLGADDV